MFLTKGFFPKFKKIWQSKNIDYKDLNIVGAFFLIFTVVCFLLSKVLVNENVIFTYIAQYGFSYLGILSILLSLAFWFFYWYVYNNSKISGKFLNVIIFLFMFFIVLSIIIAIPFTALLGTLDKIISYRAKKLDNLINFMILFAISLTITSILFYPTIILSIYLGTALTQYIPFNINLFTIQLFLIISLLKIELNLLFGMSLFLMQLHRKNKNRKVIKTQKDQYDNKFHKMTLLHDHISRKSENIKNITNNLENNMKYDMLYMRNTLKRIELAFLIIAFVILVFDIYPYDVKKELINYKGDVINVLTVYTLAMLYKDKRKEWI